jgi:hypothetical protein
VDGCKSLSEEALSMQGELRQYRGSCHCGAVTFSVRTTLSPAVRCNCSLCRRKGAVMVPVEPADFRLVSGEDSLSLYQFNTRTAKHYFCQHCGIYTFHRPRATPNIYRVNAGCLEGVDPFALAVQLRNGAAKSVVPG